MTRFRFCLALSVVTALVGGCERSADRQPPQPSASPTEPAAAVLPVAEPPLDRAALLLAVVQAASAMASGSDDRNSQRRLDGKPFEFRIRFGCGGSASQSPAPTRGWSFDDKRRVLRVWIAPEIAKETPPIKEMIGDAYEAVEGFRIARPWMLAAACPAIPAAPPAEGAPTDTAAPLRPKGDDVESAIQAPLVGIAQFFTEADARTHRRDRRAYEVTKNLGAGETPSAKGYDLILAGRLKRQSDNRVISCRGTTSDLPPSCIVSAEFDAITLERADTRERLAQWSSS